MMIHYKEVCQFGFVHAQCRCPDPSKEERKIDCPFPQGHAAVKPEKDKINPDHYKSSKSGVECIEVTEWMFFCVGNAVKYLWRLGQKDDSVQELRKAEWYITRQLDRDDRRFVGIGIYTFQEFKDKFKAHIDTMPEGHVQQAMKFLLTYYDPDSTYKPKDALKLALFEVGSAIHKAEVAGFEPAEVLPSTA